MSTQLDQIAKKAKSNPKLRFTSLAHLLTPEFLTETWKQMNRRGASGVDGETTKEFERGLDTRVRELCERLKRGAYPNVKFDFLGYCFRPRPVRRTRDNLLFGGFNPAVSSPALNTMRATVRDLNLRRQTQLSLQDIARMLNPLLRGWIGYYGRYAPSALSPLLRYVNQTLVAWAQRKFKRFKRGATLAGQFIERLATERPDLFAHWRLGMTGTFV